MLLDQVLYIGATAVPGISNKHIAVPELAGNPECGGAALELLLDVANDNGPVHLGEALHDAGEPDSAHRPVIGEVQSDRGIGPTLLECGLLRNDAPLVLVLGLVEQLSEGRHISDRGLGEVDLGGVTSETILDRCDAAEVVPL